jgi:DNA-binding response OmpR family regulator
MPKVLVVDDQPNIVRLLEMTLQKEYEVFTALDGQQVLDLVAEHHPEVIVLDVLMPVLDGYRVLHRVKSNPETAGTCVIMLTQKDRPDDIMLGFNIGADYYVPKPFNVNDVAALIRRHFSTEKR